MELYAPPGTESYYTLDGSDPDENAYLYTEPIFIEDVTPQENVHAMRTDTSVAFLYGTGDGALPYVPPAHPVDKCTVVRTAHSRRREPRNVPKSLNLYAREQYGGNGLFGADLFDTSYFAEAVILDSGGNDRFSKMRDVLVSWLAKDRAFSTMRFKPYAMFLNGEYWGVYWITEKYDPAYLAHY